MHHALVVRVENDSQMMVIHNNGKEVEEILVEMDASYIIVVHYECVFSGAQAIARARNILGDGYSMLRNNCEHFVTWARIGKGESQQVKEGYGAGLVGLTSHGGCGRGSVWHHYSCRWNPDCRGCIWSCGWGCFGLLGGIFAYLVQSKSSWNTLTIIIYTYSTVIPRVFILSIHLVCLCTERVSI